MAMLQEATMPNLQGQLQRTQISNKLRHFLGAQPTISWVEAAWHSVKGERLIARLNDHVYW
jgi:hypothetical protein